MRGLIFAKKFHVFNAECVRRILEYFICKLRIERIIKRIENKEREEMLTHRPLQINPFRGTSSSPRPGTSSDMLPLGVTQKRPADNSINSLEKKKKKEQRPSSKL